MNEHGIPEFAGEWDVESVRDGGWLDAGTWSREPGPEDVVLVRHRVEVYGSVSAQVVGIGGTLAFIGPAEMAVETIHVMEGGTLEIGTAARPLTGQVKVDFSGTVSDPLQWGLGLVAEGNVVIHGERVQPFARLAQAARKGDTTLVFEEPLKWKPGHQIYLPDSRQPGVNDGLLGQFEAAIIKSVEDCIVELDRPLLYDHLPCVDGNDVVILPVVANVSRNILFRSVGTRAHFVCTGHGYVDIRYAIFDSMGRTTTDRLDPATNPLGRYAVHRHHHHGPHQPTDSGYPFVFEGNVVTNSRKWAIVTHQSHHGLVSANVVINADGAGIVTEDGNESFNTFCWNFVSGITGRGRADQRENDWGIDGSAFFFRGGQNYVNHNVANNCQYAFSYYAKFTRKDLLYPSAKWIHADTPIDVNATPILQFADNEAFACKIGFTVWWIGAYAERPYANMPRSLVHRLDTWHCPVGVSGYETSNFTYTRCAFFGDAKKINEFGGGFGFSDYITKGLEIKESSVRNMRVGITVPAIAEARGANPDGLVRIVDCRLKCQINIVVPIPWHNANAAGIPGLFVDIMNTEFASIGGTDIKTGMVASEFTNFIAPVNVVVQNGTDHFFVCAKRQAPDAILPPSGANGRIVGSPEPGLTNKQAWDKYGISAAHYICYSKETRPGIDGFVVTIP